MQLTLKNALLYKVYFMYHIYVFSRFQRKYINVVHEIDFEKIRKCGT